MLVAAEPVRLVGGWTYGTAGDDLFIGTEYSELFVGDAGNDTLGGHNVYDIFFGGDGIDTLDFSTATEGVVVSGYGDPGVAGGAYIEFVDFNSNIGPDGYATLQGNADGVERVIGSAFDDLFWGEGSGISYVDAGAGNDQVVGSAADDMLFGSYGDDLLTTGDGFDLVYAVHSTANGDYQPNGHDVVTDFDVKCRISALSCTIRRARRTTHLPT